MNKTILISIGILAAQLPAGHSANGNLLCLNRRIGDVDGLDFIRLKSHK